MKNVTMRLDMRILVSLLTVVAVVRCHGDEKLDTDTRLSSYFADLWLEGADVIRILWRDCSKKVMFALPISRSRSSDSAFQGGGSKWVKKLLLIPTYHVIYQPVSISLL